VFNRRRGACPLPVDPLPAFVNEHTGVTGAGVKFGDSVGDGHAVGVKPRSRADPVPRVYRLVPVCRVALDAQVSAPGAAALPNGRCQSLTRGVGSSEPPRLPVVLVALVTKKLKDAPDGVVAIVSSPQLAPISTANESDGASHHITSAVFRLR
jgi:hypothetical protein